MHRRYMLFASVLFMLVLLVAASPVLGLSSLLQPSATAYQQTLDAFVGESLAQTATAQNLTQTAVVDELYATAEALYPAETTPTPNRGVDASALAQAIEANGAGWALYWDDEYFAAYLAFDLAVELAPNWAEGYIGRAYTDYTLGYYDDALADFSRAIELDPNDGDLYSWRASVLSDLEQPRLALEDYERVFADNPNLGMLYNNRGLIYQQMGLYNQALADFNRAVELDPTEPYFFNTRDYYYLLQGESGYSLMDSYMADGLYAFEAGRYGDAVADFTRILSWESTYNDYTVWYAYAHLNLGRVQTEYGNYDLALEELAQALRLYPRLAYAQVAQGEVFARQGDWAQAITFYDQAIENQPTLPVSYLKRGMAYEALGNERAAAADYWAWVQGNQARDVIWDQYQFGKSFVVHVEDSWVYYIPVEGQAGQLFSASAKTLPVDTEVDPIMVLLDPEGVPIAANNDANAIMLDAELRDVALPVDGAYTLIVSHALGYDGPVEIEVARG
ncbi:MAG: tetratricopeptide repeat protein, partial [Anaerolineae bacterium]|nr:tetratricopeptide repeat protein [Anaerolineae bacterium]